MPTPLFKEPFCKHKPDWTTCGICKDEPKFACVKHGLFHGQKYKSCHPSKEVSDLIEILGKGWGKVDTSHKDELQLPEIEKRIKKLLIKLQNDNDRKVFITPILKEIMDYIIHGK